MGWDGVGEWVSGWGVIGFFFLLLLSFRWRIPPFQSCHGPCSSGSFGVSSADRFFGFSMVSSLCFLRRSVTIYSLFCIQIRSGFGSE